MSKFYDKIGFATTSETTPGVWVSTIVERYYYGDVLNNVRNLERSDSVNDSIRVRNKISIVADPYAAQNYFSMRYISWMGVLWKVDAVEVEYPRLTLTLGDVYNGNTPTTT